MKKLILIAAISSIYFIFGCTETGQVSGPETATIEKQGGIPLSQLNVIPLPQPANKSLAKKVSTEKAIKLNRGGTLKIDHWYQDANGNWVEVYAKLRIKRNSINPDYSFYDDVNYIFSDDGKELLFSLTVDDNEVSGTFTPHIMFDEPVEFDLYVEGIDLSWVTNPDDIKFVYVPEGSLEAYVPEYDKIKINIEKGEFEIKGCLLQHFSRYILAN